MANITKAFSKHALKEGLITTAAMRSENLQGAEVSVSDSGAINADLPVELLTHVFQHVLRNSRSDLLTCMQVNRRWHREAFSILYRNVSLRLRDAKRFEDAVRLKAELSDERVQSFSFVRTLRVIIPGDGRDYGFGGTKRAGNGDDAIIGVNPIAKVGTDIVKSVLPLLTRLRSLSIVTYNGHRLNSWDEQGIGTPPGAAILSASSTRAPGPNVNILAELVQALPEGVKDLSIDVSELSRYEPMPECQMCSAINQKAPQLEHLNLHLRSYCPELLVQNYPETGPTYANLKSVIMRVHGFSARLCVRASSGGNILGIHRFVTQVCRLIRTGHLPQIKKFMIISKRRPLGVHQHPDAKWTIYVRELVADQTAAIPRLFIDSRTPGPGETFIASARTLVRLPSDCSFIDAAYWGQEYVGKSGSIRRFVEGEAGWVSFQAGPHLPGLRRKEIASALEAGFTIKAPPPKPSSEVRGNETKTCNLWLDEEIAGTKLLEPAVWQGVHDDHVLNRIVPLQ